MSLCSELRNGGLSVDLKRSVGLSSLPRSLLIRP